MPKNLYIFRNGQSSYNLAGKLQGQSNDSVLTERGLHQAEAAAGFLKDKKIDIIVSSPQRRARQTSAIVAQELKVPVFYDSRFAEVNLGTADGCNITGLNKKSRETLQKWQNHNTAPETARFEQGESKQELRHRVFAALNEYAGGDYQNIAVSSHNFSIMEALHGLQIEKSGIQNGEIIHLQYDDNGWKFVSAAC